MFNEEKERMKNRLRECVDSCISDCPPTSNPNEFCKVEWDDDGFPIEESGPRSFRNCVEKCKLEWNPAMQDAICKQCYDVEHCANLYNQPNDLCRCLWGGKCWRSENYPIPPQCDGDSEVTCCLGPPANPDSSFDPCAMLIPEHCYIFGGTPLQSGGCSDCPVHTEPLPLTFDTPTLDTPTLDTPTKTKTGGCCWGEVRPHGHQQHCRNWTLEQCNNVLGRFCGEGTECVTYDSGGIPPSCPCKPSDVPMNKSNPRKRSNKERQKFWEEYNNRK
jgi:hypothetical protein